VDAARPLPAPSRADADVDPLAYRDLALDAFRGLMVIGMVFVNHPPPDAAVVDAFVHAPWHGWTVADTIFPGFLFAVGLSVQLVRSAAASGAQALPAWGKVLRRFALLMAFNFALVNFPYYLSGTVYFTGTLAAIAWCYLAASIVHAFVGWRRQAALIAGALVLQAACYLLLPVPQHGAGVLDDAGNAARYLDQVVFVPVFGPAWRSFDGYPVLLPLLGAVASTLAGMLAGRFVAASPSSAARLRVLFALGIGLVVLGEAAQAFLPVNKKLWTGSYVLLMGGISALVLAMLAAAATRKPGMSILKALQVAGANSIFFYVFAQCLQRVLVFGRIRVAAHSTVRLRYFLYEHYVAPWAPAQAGALAYTLVFLAICYAATLLLHRRRIFLKL
jgi:predicted acyltransferase